LLNDSPADDKAKESDSCHAWRQKEMGHVLMDDGRCPDAGWARAAKGLRKGTALVPADPKNKDVEAARTDFQSITDSCAACHKAHRPAK
jgi:hypothetical protein